MVVIIPKRKSLHEYDLKHRADTLKYLKRFFDSSMEIGLLNSVKNANGNTSLSIYQYNGIDSDLISKLSLQNENEKMAKHIFVRPHISASGRHLLLDDLPHLYRLFNVMLNTRLI